MSSIFERYLMVFEWGIRLDSHKAGLVLLRSQIEY